MGTESLDHQGIEFILKTQMREPVIKAAEAMAAHIRSQGIKVGDRDGGPRERDLPVTVKVHTSDRVRAVVLINHPAAIAVEAKHGVLKKAAASQGLEVKSK